MTTVAFDTLAFSKTLQNAGMPPAQADALASAQKDAMTGIVEAARQSYKIDEQNILLEIEKLRTEVRNIELRLLKWQLVVGLALAAIMAKGFGWLGF